MADVNKLLTCDSVRKRLAKLNEAEVKECVRHSEKLAEITEERTAIIRRCQHKSKTLHMGSPYDPSYYSCDICGKEV